MARSGKAIEDLHDIVRERDRGFVLLARGQDRLCVRRYLLRAQGTTALSDIPYDCGRLMWGTLRSVTGGRSPAKGTSTDRRRLRGPGGPSPAGGDAVMPATSGYRPDINAAGSKGQKGAT